MTLTNLYHRGSSKNHLKSEYTVCKLLPFCCFSVCSPRVSGFLKQKHSAITKEWLNCLPVLMLCKQTYVSHITMLSSDSIFTSLRSLYTSATLVRSTIYNLICTPIRPINNHYTDLKMLSVCHRMFRKSVCSIVRWIGYQLTCSCWRIMYQDTLYTVCM